MAYGDSKVPKQRSTSWTKTDQKRWEAQQRRDRKAMENARLDRQKMLANMSDGDRQAFMELERQQAQAESDRQAMHMVQTAERENNRKLELTSDSRLMAGSLRSEIATAIAYVERHDQRSGDWLDDPVAAYTTGYGFAEEVSTPKGIRLQVNICMDCSNSMIHNNLTTAAVETVRTMYLAMVDAAKEMPDDSLKVNVWEWARDVNGKHVRHVTSKDHVDGYKNSPLGALEYFGWSNEFDGEDTWMYPLLERLEKWENRYGDFQAYRLDIIVSDGVLEHPTDIRMCDEIQARRDGMLQTVILNFLPIDDWANYKVPNRCVQYPATPDNLLALFRSVLGQWITTIAR